MHHSFSDVILASLSFQINLIHEVGSIEVIDYRENGTYVLGRVPRSLAMKLEKYQVTPVADDEDESNEIYSENEIDWVALGKGRHERNIS